MTPFQSIHIKDAGYHRKSDGKFIPTRFTLRSRLNGDKIEYQVAYCSHTDQYNKKIGNELASKAPIRSITPESENISDMSREEITVIIFMDIERNHMSELPYRHRTFIERNSPSDAYLSACKLQSMMSVIGDIINNITPPSPNDGENNITIH